MRLAHYRGADSLDIAEAIQLLRSELGLSQHKLAVRMGVNTGMVAHWEQRVREPSTLNIIKLAGIAGFPMCWFFLSKVGIDREFLYDILRGDIRAFLRKSDATQIESALMRVYKAAMKS